MNWKQELGSMITRDSSNEVLFSGETAARILENKDSQHILCFSRLVGHHRLTWEGPEVKGQREGQWLFFEDGKPKYRVNYAADIPWRIEGGNLEVFLQEDWAKNRSNYEKSRYYLVMVLDGIRSVEDVPAVLQRMTQAGAGTIQCIFAFREAFGGMGLKLARAIVESGMD